MEFLPAIDLRGGQCVRLHQGDFAKETVYGEDPVAQARRFADEGARWIHVVDLDASRGEGSNRDIVIGIAAAVPDVSVETGGGVQDASLLDRGIARIVLGSIAIGNRGLSQQLVHDNPGRVAIGLDHRDGELRTRGWEECSGVKLDEALAWPEFEGAAAFIITNIARDATMEGPDLDGLARAIGATTTPVIASGGVATLDDLRAVAAAGASGVIVGKALYEGRFTVEEAVAACRP